MRISIFLILSFVAFSLRADDMLCMFSDQKEFQEELSSKNFNLEKTALLDESYDFSLTIKNEVDGLPIQDIGLVRHDENDRIVLGVSIRKHILGSSAVAHLVGIPKEDIPSYKFYVSFSEKGKQCPKTKSYFINFATEE